MSRFHRVSFTASKRVAVFLIAALALSTGQSWAYGTARVYAAASIAPALEEIAALFKTQASSVVIIVSGSSSALARQIERGAPANVFVSANRAWVDYLAERHVLSDASRTAVAANTLVLIAPKARPIKLEVAPDMALASALQGRPLAICDPDHVPCGIYAKEALESLGVWETLAQQRVLRAPNARAALAWVARGEAGAGIVYASDAAADPKVMTVGALPADSHTPVIYEAAAVRGREAVTGNNFIIFLSRPAAQEILLRHGFTLPPH